MGVHSWTPNTAAGEPPLVVFGCRWTPIT